MQLRPQHIIERDEFANVERAVIREAGQQPQTLEKHFAVNVLRSVVRGGQLRVYATPNDLKRYPAIKSVNTASQTLRSAFAMAAKRPGVTRHIDSIIA